MIGLDGAIAPLVSIQVFLDGESDCALSTSTVVICLHSRANRRTSIVHQNAIKHGPQGRNETILLSKNKDKG